MRARDRLRNHGWWIILVLVLAFVVGDGLARSRHILEVSASYGVTVDPPATDARSPTGYADGRRSMVVPPGSSDTLQWVMQTQAMFAEGEWRIRRVHYDNAPAGREVHWASLYRWWLGLLAWMDHLASGRPLGVAVERATLWSGPVMLGLVLVTLVPFLARRFSPVAAGLFALATITMFPLSIDFFPGRADHHGLAHLCVLGMVLFLVVGSDRRGRRGEARDPTSGGDDRRAERAFLTASALCGGIGLWVSAATMVPALVVAGAALLLAGWLARRSPGDLTWARDPAMLCWWARVGGGVSLGAYLLEYFPGHLGWRLEVNHPLYAGAWIAAGELVRLFVSTVTLGARAIPRRAWLIGGAALVVVAVLPVTIVLTGTRTFAVMDPLLWWIAAGHSAETRGLGQLLQTSGASWGGVGLWLPILWLVPPLWLILRRRIDPGTRALLMLAWLPAVGSWVLGWGQIHWLGLAGALSAPVLGVLFRELADKSAVPRSRLGWWGLAAALVLVPGGVSVAHRVTTTAEFTAADIRALATRDVAHALRQRAGAGRVVVASAPSPTSELIYYGGLAGVGSMYWENTTGLWRSAELFAAPTAERAEELARQIGVTHIVAFSWASFEMMLARFYRGLPDDAPFPEDALMAGLLRAPVPPPWLRAVPFVLPEHPVLKGAQVRIWEVTEPQTPLQMVTRAAAYFLEIGQWEYAARLAPVLASQPADLSATVMLAAIASRRPGAPDFPAALERVISLLALAARLELEELVPLVVVLAVGEERALARQHLQAGIRSIDEQALRRLTPGTLADLLALSAGLDVSWPDPGLEQLARELVPPARRE